VVVVGASVESGTGRRGGFSCELELDAAMVAAGRLSCESRELCVGKKNKGEGKEEWDSLARQGRPGSSGSGRGARPDAAVAERPSERGVRRRSGASVTARARCVLEWGGDGARQGSSGAAAAQQARAASAQQAHGNGAARVGVRARVLCSCGVNAERRKGERERVFRSTILTQFKIKIFN